MSRALAQGDVVLVQLPFQTPKGREQMGTRPAIVTAVPQPARYPVALLVPVTTQDGAWRAKNPQLYPLLGAGVGNLTRESVALLDQLRATDVTRLQRYIGTLSVGEYDPIARGLRAIFDVE